MLDIQTGATAPPGSPAPAVEFLTIQLMPLAEGGISASLRSTSSDEVDFELLDQDIANVRIATLDELVAIIRPHMRTRASPR